MGSLAKSTNANLGVMLVITVACLFALFVVRHKVNVLAAGEDEAETMGVNVRALKVVLIVTSALLTVCAVSVAGIVGWVGLVVPHIAHLVVGSDFAKLLPTSFLIGGLLLLVIDCLICGPIGADLPLGVLTALIGTPVFLLPLNNVRKAW